MSTGREIETVKYRLFVKTTDGKWISQQLPGCRGGLTWMQAQKRLDRLRLWKEGWVGKREFPIKKIRLVEVRTKVKYTEETAEEVVSEGDL